MKRRDLLRGPRVPLRQGMGGKPLGDPVLVKRGAHLCPSPLYLGFPPGAARVGDLVLPIDPWHQAPPRPLSPRRGDGRRLQVLVDACPPKIHQYYHRRKSRPISPVRKGTSLTGIKENIR